MWTPGRRSISCGATHRDRNSPRPRTFPATRFDPQLHVHNPTFSSILTETGRVSSLNLDLLEGEVKVAGAIGHAQLATVARKHGVRVSLGPNGEARLDDVPEWLRKFHSRRTIEGTEAAKDYAAGARVRTGTS